MCSRLLLTALFCVTLCSCGGGDAGTNDAPAPLETVPHLICPVSGTEFLPGEGVLVKHAGKEYEVCSPGCAIRFESDPERFIDGDK